MNTAPPDDGYEKLIFALQKGAISPQATIALVHLYPTPGGLPSDIWPCVFLSLPRLGEHVGRDDKLYRVISVLHCVRKLDGEEFHREIIVLGVTPEETPPQFAYNFCHN